MRAAAQPGIIEPEGVGRSKIIDVTMQRVKVPVIHGLVCETFGRCLDGRGIAHGLKMGFRKDTLLRTVT